jgi:hypothetical protein
MIDGNAADHTVAPYWLEAHVGDERRSNGGSERNHSSVRRQSSSIACSAHVLLEESDAEVTRTNLARRLFAGRLAPTGRE